MRLPSPASQPRISSRMAALTACRVRRERSLACTFWLADNYAFAGRIKEAETLFERLLSLRNHLGLLSEEYAPALQRQIGNFPQAFSHLALIQTANNIQDMSAKGQIAA